MFSVFDCDKKGLTRFSNRCILFFFTCRTASRLFWAWGRSIQMIYTWIPPWDFIVGTQWWITGPLQWCDLHDSQSKFSLLRQSLHKRNKHSEETVHMSSLYRSDSMYKFHASVLLTSMKWILYAVRARFMTLDCYCSRNYSVRNISKAYGFQSEKIDTSASADR